MMVSKKVLATSALVGITALGAVGVADAAVLHQTQTPGTAQPATPHVMRVVGKIQSVNGSTLVLQVGRNRTVTANTNAGTWVLVEKSNRCAEGALSDLQTGKAAEVAGMSTSTTNTLDARVVAQGRCAAQFSSKLAKAARGKAAAGALALASHTASGTIQSITGGTLVLTAANGKQVTVNTRTSTVVFNNGFSNVSSLKVGDKVQVFGKATKVQAGTANPSNAKRTIDAVALHSESAGTKMLLGHVQKVDGNTVTVRTAANKAGQSVTFDANTSYKLLARTSQTWALTPASSADVKAGANVLIEASTAQDGKSATAEAVVVLPAGNAAQPQP